MPMLPADDLEPNERLRSLGLDAYSSTTGEVVGASFEDAWTRNPTPSVLRYLEREARDNAAINPRANVRTGEPARSVPVLSQDDANTKYGIAGELKFDRDTTEQTASDLYDLKREELRRRDIQSRAQGGFVEGAASFGAGLAATVVDPLNVASAFIPVVGEARMALWTAKAGVTSARLARGAVEGFVGAAAVEPLVYGVARSEQADYHATDSLLNLAFGTVLGGGLHAGLGKVSDLIQARRMTEPLLRDSVAAVAEDRPVQAPAAAIDAAVRAQPGLLERASSRIGDAFESARAAVTGRDVVPANIREIESRPSEAGGPVLFRGMGRAEMESIVDGSYEFLRGQLGSFTSPRMKVAAGFRDVEADISKEGVLSRIEFSPEARFINKDSREFREAEARATETSPSGRKFADPKRVREELVSRGVSGVRSKGLSGYPQVEILDRSAITRVDFHSKDGDLIASAQPRAKETAPEQPRPETVDPTAIRHDEKPALQAVDAIVTREPAKAAPRAEGAAPLGPKAAEAQAELDAVMQQIDATRPGETAPPGKEEPDAEMTRAESDAKAYEQASFCLGRNNR